MSGKNKNIPVPCRMVLRFLKETNLYKEWYQEAEKKVIKDNQIGAFPIETNIKFQTFSEKWLWYVHNGKFNRYMHNCPINNILDYTLMWSKTRRGYDFWRKMNLYWKDLFLRYHSERTISCSLKGIDATDDVTVFVKIMMDFLREKKLGTNLRRCAERPR